MLAAGTVFAGYTLAVDTVLAQAIKTDTSGLADDDFTIPVGGFDVPVYEARPASGQNHPVVLVISEVFGLPEYIKESPTPITGRPTTRRTPRTRGSAASPGSIPF